MNIEGDDDEIRALCDLAVTEFGGEDLDFAATKRLIHCGFGSQKAFAHFLGVSPTAVSNWMSDQNIPLYARRMAYAVYALGSRKRVSHGEPSGIRIVAVHDDDEYALVRIYEDDTKTGAIVLRGIKKEQTAQLYAKSRDAWQLLTELSRLHRQEENAAKSPEMKKLLEAISMKVEEVISLKDK